MLKIAVVMAVKNSEETVRRALLSVIMQKSKNISLKKIILDDSSTDSWYDKIEDLIDKDTIIIKAKNGSAYKTRNMMHQYIYDNLHMTDYIARLDSDDEILDCNVFSKVGNILKDKTTDVLVMGNALRRGNKVLKRINAAQPNLLNLVQLLKRLKRMAEGDLLAELPSCNTVFKVSKKIYYPPEESGEDHWLLASLLSNPRKYKITIQKDLIYCIYNLSGKLSKNNQKKDVHLESRVRLYETIRMRSEEI